MMIARLIAIGFIFVCTSVAWFVLAGVTTTRTHFADKGLRQQVESVWGAPQDVDRAGAAQGGETRRRQENRENRRG
jgi:hypothetical protein